MRVFTQEERPLLAIAEHFRQVEKYLGILPEQYLVAFDKRIIERLVAEDILEKARLKSYSQKIKGVRLTPLGSRMWREAQGMAEPPPVNPAGLAVRDILLMNLLSYTDEAVPKKEALKRHPKAALLEAYQMGFLAKVRLKKKDQEMIKGYIVTSAGYAWLKGNGLL